MSGLKSYVKCKISAKNNKINLLSEFTENNSNS